MKLSLLSKYRTELMGIAIIYICLFHMCDLISMNRIFYYGYMGVDIFLLLSGMGLFFSWEKNNNIKEFYIKRVERVLPAYLIIASIYILFLAVLENTTGLKWSIYIFTGINFWAYGDSIFWYIPATIVLYFLFPIFIKLLKNEKQKNRNLILLIALFYIFAIILGFSKYNYLLVFLTRVPIFILGIYIGKLMKNRDEVINGKIMSILFLIGAFILYIASNISKEEVINKIGTKWIILLIVVIPLCFFIGYVMEKLEKNYVIKKINKLLVFFGKHSLEIYLVHVLIFRFDKSFQKIFFKEEILNELRILIYIIVITFIAVIMNKVIEKINKKVNEIIKKFNKQEDF